MEIVKTAEFELPKKVTLLKDIKLQNGMRVGMCYLWKLNNYTVSKIKYTPKDKIVARERIDDHHEIVLYQGLDNWEYDLTSRYFARKPLNVMVSKDGDLYR